MANPKFVGVDLAAVTLGWSAGVNPSYPEVNLLNYFPDSKSRANATTAGQTLDGSLSPALSCDTLIVEGQNFASLGATSVKLQYNDGVTPWADVVTLDIVDNNVQLKSFNALTIDDFRLLFSKGSALSAAPEVANVFLGKSFDFGKTQDWECVTGVPDFVTSSSRALDGRERSAQSFGGFKRWSMKFTLFSDSVLTNWLTFLSTIRGDGRPFYFVDDNSAIYLVRFEQSFNSVTRRRYNLNDTVQLGFHTVLANY